MAFANPDPGWPPEGDASRVEEYERRGQKAQPGVRSAMSWAHGSWGDSACMPQVVELTLGDDFVLFRPGSAMWVEMVGLVETNACCLGFLECIAFFEVGSTCHILC